MEDRHILRGDIYYADLRPVVGCEQDGVRPVLIIQNNIGNHYSPTVIAAAITSRRTKAKLPTHVCVGRVPGMYPGSLILLEQIRTLDKSRLLEYVGRVPQKTMRKVDRALRISVGQAEEDKDDTFRTNGQLDLPGGGTDAGKLGRGEPAEY